MKKLLGLLSAAWLVLSPLADRAAAQTAATYQLTDSASVVHQTHGFQCLTSLLCLAHVPIDFSGNPFGITSNPFFVAPASGATFPVSGTISCSNCSGSGVSVPFAGAIGANGTPGGFKDGSGNFQPLLGDTSFGQWVNIKQSVSLGVTGTFWQATQPVSIASMPSTPVTGTFWPYTLGQQLAGSSVPVVLTAAQLTTLTPPAAITGFALDTSVGTTNTNLGAPGATACATDTGSCSVNAFLQRLAQRLTTINTTLGTPMQASGGSVTANAGTNLNTSLLALEGGGNLASLVTQLGAVTASPTANTIGDRLKTINTTLGTPYQAGGALPLPSGAATAAKQPALGTAGTPSADVITVQGAASMTALKTDGSGVTQPISGTVTANAGTNLNTSALALETGGNLAAVVTNTNNLALAQASTTSGQKGNLALGAVTTAAPSYTTAQSNPLSLTPAGALRVDGSAVTQPVSAASLPLPALAATSTKQSDGTQKTQVVDGSGNVQPSGDVVARAIFEKVTDGTNTAAVKAASTNPAATDPALVVALSPNNGITPVVSTSAEATHVIKASAGLAEACYAINLTSTPGFLILLNATSAPADGAVTPLAVAPLPANGAGVISSAMLAAMTFSTGITAVLTSATAPFTKTTGVITGFISCQAI
jgi:hypothetical protein